MKRIIILCIAFVLALSGCGRAPAAEIPKPETALPHPTGISALRKEKPAALSAEGKERFLHLLDSASRQQQCTAGSSLRLAALGGELLRWLTNHPGQQQEALRVAGEWAGRQNGDAARQAARSFRWLSECSLRMEEEDLRLLLYDAGCSLPDQGPSREEFSDFTESLVLVLDANYSEILKNNEYFSLKSLQTAEKRVMMFVNTRKTC